LIFLPRGTVHEAFDSVFEMHDVEADQQANRFPAELEVGNHLRVMHGTDTLNRLNLDNHEVFDEQIHPITEIQFRAVIHDRKPDLRLGANSCLAKFVLQARLLRALQQARAEFGMDLDGCGDDCVTHCLGA
jgi:CheY-like chemotaxis protein